MIKSHSDKDPFVHGLNGKDFIEMSEYHSARADSVITGSQPNLYEADIAECGGGRFIASGRGLSLVVIHDRQGMSAKQAARIRGSKISQDADQFAANTLPVIAAIRKAGINSFNGIAKALNDRGIPTARGTSWYAATVKNVTAYQAAA